MKIDSNEEEYFLWWLEELPFVEEINDAETYILSEGVSTRLGISNKEKTILKPIFYTPDFKIKISDYPFDKGEKFDLFGDIVIQDGISIIEVKPDFDKNNMTRAVMPKIKWVYEKYGDVVSLVKIPSLFKKTFTPEKYLITKTGKKRKIKWKPIKVNEYLSTYPKSGLKKIIL